MNRRRFLKGSSVLGATITLGVQFSSSVKGVDDSQTAWTTYRGNAGRSGATSDRGPGPNVTTTWSFDMDGGMHTTEPVVADETVYIAVTTAQSPSTSKGYIAAYNPRSQKQIWKRDGISRPSTPTIENGTVYLETEGSEDANTSGFFALDSNTGETKWHKPDSFGLTNPLAADGKLFGTVSGKATQHDSKTGDVIWKTESVSGTSCYADGTLIYGNGIALNADNGTVKWDVSNDTDTLQAVTNGTVYGVTTKSGSAPAIHARSITDGTHLWSHAFEIDGYWPNNQVTVADGLVFFHAENIIRALDASTGKEVWTYKADAALSGALAVGDDTLYAGGRTNPSSDTGKAVVIAIQISSGNRTWKHEFGNWDFDEYGPAANSPIVADGKVYTATYPMGSTLDWTYTQYGDLHVLGSNSESTTTTSDETTTAKTTTPQTSSSKTVGTRQASETSKKVTTTTVDGKTATAESTTTASDGQPGFGVLTAIGGLTSVGSYILSRSQEKDK